MSGSSVWAIVGRVEVRWLAGIVAVGIVHWGVVRGLLGPDRRLEDWWNDQPLVSGRHALHQYHGYIKAQAAGEGPGTTGYDLAFQAGYPVTPVFDASCRVAEGFYRWSGGNYHPAPYKIGLLAVVMWVPLATMLATVAVSRTPAACLLGGLGGVGLVASPWMQELLRLGEGDLLVASMGVLVFLSWWIRFTYSWEIEAWLLAAAGAAVVWYCQPLLAVATSSVVFVQYVVVGPRMGWLWHLSLVGVACVGIVPNAGWLSDWIRYWWLRSAGSVEWHGWSAVMGILRGGEPLPEGGGTPWFGAATLLGTATAAWYWRRNAPGGVWLLLLAAAWATMAQAIVHYRLQGEVRAQLALLTVSLQLPVWAALMDRLMCGHHLRRAVWAGIAAASLLAAWCWGAAASGGGLANADRPPLQIGWTAEQAELIRGLRQWTSPDGRILWEERTSDRHQGSWAALVPVVTGRALIGGLDPDGRLEHSYCACRDGEWLGRRLAEWSDAELAQWCDWYNIGWVVARTAEGVARWQRFPKSRKLLELRERGQPLVLFALDRQLSYVLSGAAQWQSADLHRIVLTQVQPNAHGEVQLSMHWWPQLRVAPSYVRIERLPEPTGRAAVDHVRLLLPGPVPHLVITWED